MQPILYQLMQLLIIYHFYISEVGTEMCLVVLQHFSSPMSSQRLSDDVAADALVRSHPDESRIVSFPLSIFQQLVNLQKHSRNLPGGGGATDLFQYPSRIRNHGNPRCLQFSKKRVSLAFFHGASVVQLVVCYLLLLRVIYFGTNMITALRSISVKDCVIWIFSVSLSFELASIFLAYLLGFVKLTQIDIQLKILN